MITAISTAQEASAADLQRMNDLEQVSRKIDKIVDAIANVALQTNMLAVNGAIEAARAGEYGKGFAVVATDIRNLAQDAAENAETIKDLVKAIQDQIALVVRDMDEIGKTALAEVEKAKGTTQKLEQVEGDMATVLDGNKGIGEIGVKLEAMVAETQKGIEQIGTAAEQASKLVLEAQTAAQEQSKGAEQLAAGIEEISSVADELQSAA